MILLDQNNRAVFGDAVGITATEAYGLTWRTTDFHTGNATLVDVPLPAGFVAGQFDLVNGALVPNASYVEPAPVVPAEITMRQARLVLLGAGLLSGVQTAIDGLPEPQRSAANIDWEFSNTLQRRNPFVLTLGPALGLSAAQIDGLFTQGAAL